MIVILNKQTGIPVYGYIGTKDRLDKLEEVWNKYLNHDWYIVRRYDK